MKQKFLYFALGLLMCVGLSATSVSVMTVKPQPPKTVVIKIVDTAYEAKEIALNGVRTGFTIKSITSGQVNVFKNRRKNDRNKTD